MAFLTPIVFYYRSEIRKFFIPYNDWYQSQRISIYYNGTTENWVLHDSFHWIDSPYFGVFTTICDLHAYTLAIKVFSRVKLSSWFITMLSWHSTVLFCFAITATVHCSIRVLCLIIWSDIFYNIFFGGYLFYDIFLKRWVKRSC